MGRLQIFVQAEGARDIRVLELPADATVRELVEAAQAQGLTTGAATPKGSHAPQNGNGRHGDGSAGDGVAVYAEEGDDALPLGSTLKAAGLGNDSSVHLSRCKRVGVTVHYNGAQRATTFGPGVPMHRVKRWAVGKQGFGLAPVDAAEHVLQVTGTTDRPDEDVHIGALVGTPSCAVAFDLVAKVRVEG